MEGTVGEDLCTYMMSLNASWNGKISDKNCREKTHFMFNNFSPKIVPFMI